MAHYVKISRHPLSSVTNHGLIKLLVQKYLARHNLTSERFITGVGMHWEPAIGYVGEREIERRSSGWDGGRGEETEEGGDDQEEYLGEAAAAANLTEEMVGGDSGNTRNYSSRSYNNSNNRRRNVFFKLVAKLPFVNRRRIVYVEITVYGLLVNS